MKIHAGAAGRRICQGAMAGRRMGGWKAVSLRFPAADSGKESKSRAGLYPNADLLTVHENPFIKT
jgi:hypothetical protein